MPVIASRTYMHHTHVDYFTNIKDNFEELNLRESWSVKLEEFYFICL